VRRPIRRIATAAVAVAMISACNDGVDAGLDPDRVAYGGELYQQQCASCHRTDLSGDPDWKTPNEDGSYPPPPHDSSGHTWHHPDRVLVEIIREGSDFPQSRMPSFGDKLTEEEIKTILEFFKANWGAQERAYQDQVTKQDESQPLGP
jgi:mono/diheme cytochrome c family protein